MLKKTVTYTNFNDKEKSVDLYFNLTRTELLKIDSDLPGGIQKTLESAVELFQQGDQTGIKSLIDLFVSRAYGVRSDDGESFIKNDGALYAEFTNTAAYDEFYMSLFESEEGLMSFFNGIMPQAVQDEVAKLVEGDRNGPEA